MDVAGSACLEMSMGRLIGDVTEVFFVKVPPDAILCSVGGGGLFIIIVCQLCTVYVCCTAIVGLKCYQCSRCRCSCYRCSRCSFPSSWLAFLSPRNWYDIKK